ASFNTLRLHSHAGEFVLFESISQLKELSEAVRQRPRAFVLGGGSNVVLACALDCLVIKVQTRGVHVWAETADEWVIEAQAGEVWHDFVDLCLTNGWPGLENLALIPGTVGAAPVQNIG